MASVAAMAFLSSSAGYCDSIGPAGMRFFESKIRPVLVKHCYRCHSSRSEDVQGGLLLDTYRGIRDGGDSGHAVIPGNLDDSILIRAIRYEDYEMPPEGQLPESVIADFEHWVQIGAPDPRAIQSGSDAEPMDMESGREFWAFQPIGRIPPPDVDDSQWSQNPIDRYILGRLQARGMHPVGPADRETLLRRLSYDLTGLPPAVKAIDDFVGDDSPEAIHKVVNRLLASSAFGERWGRHWLDVARYAQSMGKTRNFPFPDAWRYRDYVIDAFNSDKPYDRFIREQIAGDLLPYATEAERQSNLIATGFLAMGSHDLNQRQAEVYAMNVVSEQIDTTTRAFLALTVGCARCHDHKFDPIPTEDYYALAGIFRSTELYNGYVNRRRDKKYGSGAHLISLSEPDSDQFGEQTENAGQRDIVDLEAERDQVQKRLRRLRNQQRQLGKTLQVNPAHRRKVLATLKRRMARNERKLARLDSAIRSSGGRRIVKPDGPTCMGVRDSAKVVDCRVNIGGEVDRLGDPVLRGYIDVVSPFDSPPPGDVASGRRELSRWLASPVNPLTARVMVNRIWQHLFGVGIVRTVDNFGAMGERPSHPALLDYLAARFIESRWSVKSLIREIVLSRTYQLSSQYDAHCFEVDPDNRFLWRMNRRRLDFESIRDSILLASGRLRPGRPEEPLLSDLASKEIRRVDPSKLVSINSDIRSIYLPVIRSHLPDMMTTFDFPNPSEVSGSRDVTVMPTQALVLLNNPLVIRCAQAAADRVLHVERDRPERVTMAYRQVLGRFPTATETAQVIDYVETFEIEESETDLEGKVARRAWTQVYHALFACAEFRYRD